MDLYDMGDHCIGFKDEATVLLAQDFRATAQGCMIPGDARWCLGHTNKYWRIQCYHLGDLKAVVAPSLLSHNLLHLSLGVGVERGEPIVQMYCEHRFLRQRIEVSSLILG